MKTFKVRENFVDRYESIVLSHTDKNIVSVGSAEKITIWLLNK